MHHSDPANDPLIRLIDWFGLRRGFFGGAAIGIMLATIIACPVILWALLR